MDVYVSLCSGIPGSLGARPMGMGVAARASRIMEG